MTEKEPIDIDFEEVETEKKKWLKNLFKAVRSSLQENLDSHITKRDAKIQEKQDRTQDIKKETLEKKVKSQKKRLEMIKIERILNISENTELTKEGVKKIIQSERFQSLSPEDQKKLSDNLTKRKDANEAEIERNKNQDNYLKNLDKQLKESEQLYIDGKYNDAIKEAERVKKKIKYKQETLLSIKSILNATIFRIKKVGELSSSEKSNMTTLFLPDGIDTTLKERESTANNIIWEAMAKLKLQTKAKAKYLAHPKEVEKKMSEDRKPIYQGRLIVSFQKDEENMPVKLKIIRKVENDRKLELFIVQERGWEHLFGILDKEGKSVIKSDFMRKWYRIVGNNIFYKTISNKQEKWYNLVTEQEITL